MTTESPYEQIKFINDVIKDRQDKNQPTFFSVKVERFGEVTPMVNKEQGANFYETILQYLTRYELSALLIELYNGKAHNIKEPFRNFRILLKKSSDISIGNSNTITDIPVTTAETIISPEKHFLTLAEKERQLMQLEFDLKRLQYENDELKRKNKKKKNYIAQLESELGKTEKDKKNSLGNVSFGMIGANAIESFAKSSFGLGILKNVFGAKEEMLNGLLGIAETKTEQSNEPKSTATVITTSETPQEQKEPLTENEKIRITIKKFITEFLDRSNDAVLRGYYELIQLLGSDMETLQSVLNQVKEYREKQKAFIEQKIKNTSNKNEGSELEEEKDDDDLDDTS